MLQSPVVLYAELFDFLHVKFVLHYLGNLPEPGVFIEALVVSVYCVDFPRVEDAHFFNEDSLISKVDLFIVMNVVLNPQIL